ncbi:MAG: hypothetical protein ACQEWV_30525 [Bacillota bacterium]
MSGIQTELKEWIAKLSGNDPECEQKIRKLLDQDKDLIKEINVAYEDRNVKRVQHLIKSSLLEKNVIVRACKVCSKMNFISSNDLINGINCEQCHQVLLRSDNVKNNEVENKSTEGKRNCVSCGKPVFIFSDSMTCYKCRLRTSQLYRDYRHFR